jgi:glycine N-methyltransferase
MENGYHNNDIAVADCVQQSYNDDQTAKILNNRLFVKTREQNEFLVGTLRKYNVHTVLDVACGTGPDSIQLVEAGFKVFSTDLSDKMLKYALEERWKRRKEPNFDEWVIKEANWLTLHEDLEDLDGKPAEGFDAVICMGSSIAHIMEENGGTENTQHAMGNIMSFVKPGGIFMFDHRNFDYIVSTKTLPESINYPWIKQIEPVVQSSVRTVRREDGTPKMVISCYDIDVDKLSQEQKKLLRLKSTDKEFHVNLHLYPHSLADIVSIVKKVSKPGSQHHVLGNFRPLGDVASPAYYEHVVVVPK